MYRIFIAAFMSYFIVGCGGSHHGGGSGGGGGGSTLAWSSPATLDRGFLGQADDRLLVVSGGTPPYTVTLAGGAPPNGIVVSSATSGGHLTGTPSLNGQYDFTLTVVDAAAHQAQQSFTWRISDPVVVAGSTPNGKVGTPYSSTFTATGGVGGPYGGWKIANGAAPPSRLMLDSSSGVLSGTPTTAGFFQFIITVKDGGTDNGVGQKSLSLTVQ